MDGQLTLKDIREILATIVTSRALTDPNISFMSGLNLFGHNDLDHLPDGLHPDPNGYRMMADRFIQFAGGWAREPSTFFLGDPEG